MSLLQPMLRSYRPYRPRRPMESLAPVAGAEAVLAERGRDAASYTVGLEEELFLVHAGSLECVVEMPEAFLAEARRELETAVKREIIASMIELVTGAHESLAAAGEEMRRNRLRLGVIAARHGLALMASGTHPFADWRDQTLSPKPRYEMVKASLGVLSQRVHVCGFHIHVALPDPAQRIGVMNRAQGFLPLLLALSTSSPLWRGASTGLKSYRSAAYDESPRTGLPIRFADALEFERYVAKLEAAGFIPDQSFLWWAIRPSLSYPTLELRIADTCTSPDDAIAIAALYRCLVHALTLDPGMGAAWEDHHYLLNQENRWQAIRYGLEGHVIDAASGEKTPMRTAVTGLVEQLASSASALGCEAELSGVAAILAAGTSADRQASAFEAARARGASEAEAAQDVAARIAAWTLAA